MEILLFLSLFFLASYLIGHFLKKLRIPWIFSSLLIGLVLSIKHPFESVTTSDSFLLLSELGMYFLLFLIGYEFELRKVLKEEKYIFTTSLLIIVGQSIVGTIIVHYFFNLTWAFSLLIAAAFATVGEAVLLPIIDEAHMIRTKLGRALLGVGVVDDILEIGVLLLTVSWISALHGHNNLNIAFVIIALLALSLLGLVFVALRKHIPQLHFKEIPSFFLFILFVVFFLVGIGSLVEAGALGAILAGIAVRNMISKDNSEYIDNNIRTISYGFLAPIFFLWVGVNTNVLALSQSPLPLLTFALAIGLTTLGIVYFWTKKHLGKKAAFLAGIGLNVRLSTSIVVFQLLFNEKLISVELYTMLIGSVVLLTLIVPPLLLFFMRKFPARDYMA